ncbi:hypothetical protein B0H13DRAFT_1901079 [Mycena leptocephala]|nr:hypothetical protein B0H13DRAFT_1901079 [Mycena leptocephala]
MCEINYAIRLNILLQKSHKERQTRKLFNTLLLFFGDIDVEFEARENWIDGLQTVSAPQKHIYFDSIDGKIRGGFKTHVVRRRAALFGEGIQGLCMAFLKTHPSSVQFRFLFMKDLFAVGPDGDFPLKMRIKFFGGANRCLGFFNIFVYLGFKRGLPLARAQPDLR